MFKGKSNDIISLNTAELRRSGKSEAEATAMAMREAGKADKNKNARVAKKVATPFKKMQVKAK